MDIKISVRELVDFLVAKETLARLESGGVDNWEWYGESLNPHGAPSMDEFKEMLVKKYESPIFGTKQQ